MSWAREKTCTSKKAYPTAGLAAQAALTFMQVNAGIERMSAYRCPYCWDWHISRQTRNDTADPAFLLIDKPPPTTPRGAVLTRRTQKKVKAEWTKHRAKRGPLPRYKTRHNEEDDA